MYRLCFFGLLNVRIGTIFIAILSIGLCITGIAILVNKIEISNEEIQKLQSLNDKDQQVLNDPEDNPEDFKQIEQEIKQRKELIVDLGNDIVIYWNGIGFACINLCCSFSLFHGAIRNHQPTILIYYYFNLFSFIITQFLWIIYMILLIISRFYLLVIGLIILLILYDVVIWYFLSIVRYYVQDLREMINRGIVLEIKQQEEAQRQRLEGNGKDGGLGISADNDFRGKLELEANISM